MATTTRISGGSQNDSGHVSQNDFRYESNLELDDLVYSYPDIKTPGFQTHITSKYEFNELSSSIKDPIPRRGEFFKHQILIHRFLLIYDKLLLIHRTGTGKTCAAGGSSELFKRSTLEAVGDFIEQYMKPQRTHIKHVYILVKGGTVGEEFKNQLVCKCSRPGDYETKKILESETEKQRKNNITREIHKFYTIVGYRKFSSDIYQQHMSNEDIKREFSNSMFIFDEIHNLRIDPLKQSEKKQKKQKIAYDTLYRVFHSIERSKIILMTATPMINEPWEIATIMNLLLPLDKTGLDGSIIEKNQMPYRDTYNYDNPNINDLEPYFRGYVSYVRELDSMARPIFMGGPIQYVHMIDGKEIPSQQIVWSSLMSPEYQGKGYLKSIQEDTRKKGAFHESKTEASNFVFPDLTYGKDGFEKYVLKIKTGEYEASPELLPWISNEEYLKLLSSKYTEIIRLTKEGKGNVFCFSNLLHGSGAIVLSLCFKAMGFERFDESVSIFLSQKLNVGGISPVCPPDRDPDLDREIPPDRPMRISKGVNRYALLTSENESKISTILDTFNSPENRHGELIKILIASPIAREGINTANVIQIHLVGPDWNEAASYQALSRALRATSHIDLLIEKRKKYRMKGRDPDDATVKVKIYKHAAVLQTDDPEEPLKSIDISMYISSEIKNISIKKIERIMKKVSFDCQIHKERNKVKQIGGVSDGNVACDYDTCEYDCYDPPPQYIDYSSYDIIYSPDVFNAIEDVKLIFRNTFNINLEDLYNRLNKYKRKFVDMAIEKIVSEKILIIDRFGYPSYLGESSGVLFVQKNYPLSGMENVQASYEVSFYSSHLNGIDETILTDYVSELKDEFQTRIIGQIEKMDFNDPNFDTIFDSMIEQLTIGGKIIFFEKAFYKVYVENVINKPMEAIIEKYKNMVFKFHEPTADIKKASEMLSGRGKGRGRKPGSTRKSYLTIKVESSALSEENLGEEVYIHILHRLEEENTRSTIIAKIPKKLRILKPLSRAGWRDVEPYEETVYNGILVKAMNFQIEEFEKHLIYGIYDKNRKEFKIRDKSREKEGVDSNAKLKRPGKVCSTWYKPDLVSILWYFKILPPIDVPISSNTTRKDLIDLLRLQRINITDEIVSTFPNDKLIFYYKWYSRKSYTKEAICTILKQYFIENNLLTTI